MAADTSKSVQHILERSLVSLNANADDPNVVFNDLTVEDDLTVSGDLSVTGAVTLAAGADLTFDDLFITGPFEVGVDNSERAAIKGIVLSGAIAVSVPSITDPDIAKVDVDVSSLTFAPAVGDAVIAIPAEALPANARLQGAWVSAIDQVQITFGSEGGNVVGAAKNFTFLFIDLT